MTCTPVTIPSSKTIPQPPSWVARLLSCAPLDKIGTDPTLCRQSGDKFALISTSILYDDLEGQTTRAYQQIFANLRGQYPVRFWNHIPRINDLADESRNRYMVFNAGRYRAMSEIFGPRFADQLPTASGVGNFGDHLVIHCLAANEPGLSIDNPRQTPPWKYSSKYGPQPPCFARATRINDLLLIGGTASVRGEDSVHGTDFGAQLHETIRNLAALAPLESFTDLRVYYPRLEDEGAIVERIDKEFPSLRAVELVHAELCRSELLVEIEAVAEVS